MNRNSNTYTFIYASVMVIIVATILSVAAISLKPFQTRNVEIEKKQNILAAVQIESTVENAESKYEKFITDTYVVNSKGAKVEGEDPFYIKLKVEHRKELSEQSMPVFEATLENGETKYVIPLYGAGLWGPIWGYISFNEDMNTVYGAFFDHQGETPGLGAEITTEAFQKPFTEKTIFDKAGEFVSIYVAKQGDKSVAEAHSVDAISGGTITSKGLQDMLKSDLAGYIEFFNKEKK